MPFAILLPSPSHCALMDIALQTSTSVAFLPVAFSRHLIPRRKLFSIEEISHPDFNAGCSQRKLVEVTSTTTLHAKAPEELLNVKRLSAVELVAELRTVSVPMSETRLSFSLSEAAISLGFSDGHVF